MNSKRTKRSDLKRACPSGKRGFKKPGDALAAAPERNRVTTYRCPDCKQYHLADLVGRKERQRRAQEGTA